MNAYVEHRLQLPCDVKSVSKARSFARDVLGGSGLEGLVGDCQLLVSELVTNVVLHAGTDLNVRCFTFSNAVRFEIRDGSAVLPGIRHYDATSTTGRGIRLVEEISSRWGASRESHGKVVWFEMGDNDALWPQAAVHSGGSDEDEGDFMVRFERLPVALVTASMQYGDALIRDIALRDMRENSDPGAWRSPQIDLTPVLTPVNDAHVGGMQVIDVEARFPRRARSAALERLTRVNEAEELARAGVIATPVGLPELGTCRTWLLSEIALQAEGASSTPWKMVDDLEPHGAPLTLTTGEQGSLQEAGTAVVVADTTHRIIYATESAGALLGWQVSELVGRRLSVIVPVAHREAHLAGFARYAITKQPRLIGSTVLVPALRRDGSMIELALTLHKVTFAAGDAFAATLEETRPV